MLGLLFFAAAFADSIVETINNDPTSTWVAVEYPARIITHAKMLARLGATPAVSFNTPYSPNSALPTEFDVRTKWPSKVVPVLDQAHCGSCWAFSIVETFSDRLEIAGKGVGMLSVQDLISCDTTDLACQGGYMDHGYNWVKNRGIATEKCIPYESGTGRVPPCPTTCKDGSPIVRYKFTNWAVVKGDEIQQELYDHGPVGVDFVVYSDFMMYRSGVYQHKTGYREGGHAVVFMGWGVEGGVPYWLVQNSWGAEWGEKGFFKILRGANECNIENDVIAITL